METREIDTNDIKCNHNITLELFTNISLTTRHA